MTPYERALDIVMTKDVSAEDIANAITEAIEAEREACAVDAYDEYLRARELQARRGDYGGDLFRAGITQGRAQAASLIAARIRARSERQTMEADDDSKNF